MKILEFLKLNASYYTYKIDPNVKLEDQKSELCEDLIQVSVKVNEFDPNGKLKLLVIKDFI